MNKISIRRFATFTFVFYLISCATITVNVYFPAEEVRQAYSNLEDEFILEDEGAEESVQPEGGDSKLESETKIANKEVIYKDEPTVTKKKIIPLKKNMSLEIAKVALAQDNITKQIESKIRSKPDVIKTYKSRNARQAKIEGLLGSGKVGEANNGLLAARGQVTAADNALIAAENKDRGVIINAMSVAIIEINKLEATPQNIKKVYPEAAEQFAITRRSKAKSGWKVQLPNGKWAAKR